MYKAQRIVVKNRNEIVHEALDKRDSRIVFARISPLTRFTGYRFPVLTEEA